MTDVVVHLLPTTTTMSLTPEQARALWDAGGFALIQGLPRGSEVGIDGTWVSTSGLPSVLSSRAPLTPGTMSRMSSPGQSLCHQVCI